MEKNVKGRRGAWQLDMWKWQVSNPQVNALNAVFILEDKKQAILELAFWKKENKSVSHHWSVFFNCKFF